MSGVKNCQIALNQPFDKWEGIYAVDTNGNNITSSITISGNVDVTKPGVYTLIYYLSDNFGTDLAYYRYVTVGEGETSNAADNNNNKHRQQLLLCHPQHSLRPHSRRHLHHSNSLPINSSKFIKQNLFLLL